MNKEKIIHTPWFFSVEEILEKLETTEKGLSEEEASKRKAIFGENILTKKTKTSLPKIALKQFASPLIFILIGAAVLTFILREWVNVGVITGAILINAGLGFYREYQAENTLEKLNTYIKDRTRVIRNSKEQEIDSSLLVPGDIIEISYGSRIPADARILSANNLRIDEAVLTGESAPVSKNNENLAENTIMAERKNIAYAGTLVTEGFAKAIIVTIGENTEIGKIASVVSSTDRAITPIQKGVNKLSWYIFYIVVGIVLGIFFLGISRGEPTIQMLILSAAVAVGAVPEALPIALTVILSVGAERIAKKKGIIRNLSAAETLGSATLIMTDKTGTLTEAKMQLMGVHTIDDLMQNIETKLSEKISLEQKEILEYALRNSNVIIENQELEKSKWNFIGRPFEANIAKACLEYGIDVENIISDEHGLEIPFNSTNKFSVAKTDRSYLVMGAPDILVKKSNLSETEKTTIENWILEASNNGKRLIAIASLPKNNNNLLKKEDVENLEFKGILSFFDPIRKEVPAAIKNIEEHGVRVVIITGDLKGTAMSVARSLGWQIEDKEVLTGADIKSMKDEELLDVIPQIKIFARVTPEDKLRIGTLYRQLGEIVGMTGDGVNDSPALKAMDIGISLGSGSDVAKSAADLVLLDDNFETISLAIDEGRRILANIRKTFTYLMSNSLDAVFLVGGSLIINIALPLTALQIIWVNLFTGSLPAIAFAFDENLDKGLSGKKGKKELLNTEVKFLSLALGTLTSVLLFILYYLLIKSGIEIGTARSVFFACFSVYVLVIAFSFRSLKQPIFSYNPFGNKNLNYAILLSMFLLVATMSVPFMRDLFEISVMPFSMMWIVILWSVVNIAFVELAKWLFRKYTK
jgi:P-type Ca2+ transporter type 2C